MNTFRIALLTLIIMAVSGCGHIFTRHSTAPKSTTNETATKKPETPVKNEMATPKSNSDSDSEAEKPAAATAESSPAKIDQDIVRSTIQSRNKEFSNCHKEYLKSNPGLKGRVLVEIDVDSDGSVIDARVPKNKVTSRDIQDNDLKLCVLNVFKSIKFKPNTDGYQMTVTYPVVFSTP